jgi:4-hydroxy-tetrahydrodipicolinate reductase
MNIAIVGYGRMGREVERIARERGHTVVACLDISDEISATTLKNAECCIEFSVPDSAVRNIERVASCGRNIVVGTTGWFDHLDDIRTLVEQKKIGLLYGANFSVGVNLFFDIVRTAARLLRPIEGYDAAVHETHHRNKVDSPSGTALTIGKILLEEYSRKKSILSGTSHQAISPDQLHITSARTGTFPGTHEITFDSALDTIELKHTMKNRSGFALGAVIAAEWLAGRKGIFTFHDVLTSS